jgi:hypothetical protein
MIQMLKLSEENKSTHHVKNVSVEHNSKINKLHNNSLKNIRTSSTQPNIFIHHNSHGSIMNT